MLSDLPDVLTYDQVADVLQVHRSTISRRVADGVIRPVGDLKRITKVELLRYLGVEVGLRSVVTQG